MQKSGIIAIGFLGILPAGGVTRDYIRQQKNFAIIIITHKLNNMDEAVFNKIAELLSKSAYIPLEKITPESSFQQLGLDSLDALALINDLEEEYNVKISNQEVLKIRTIEQAVETIQKAIG